MKTRGSLAAVIVLGALAVFWAVDGGSRGDDLSISATEGSGSEVVDDVLDPEDADGDEDSSSMDDLEIGLGGDDEPDQLALNDESVAEELPADELPDDELPDDELTADEEASQVQASTSTIVVGSSTTISPAAAPNTTVAPGTTAGPGTTAAGQTSTTQAGSSTPGDSTQTADTSSYEAGTDGGAKQVVTDGSGQGSTVPTTPTAGQTSETSGQKATDPVVTNGETIVIREVAKALIVTDNPKPASDDLAIAAPASTNPPVATPTPTVTTKDSTAQTPASKEPTNVPAANTPATPAPATKAPATQVPTTKPAAAKPATTKAPTPKPATTKAPAQAPTTKAPAATPPSGNYGSNLALIKAASVRNKNHDNSPHRNTPSASLTPSNHYGPRSAYLNNPGGNPEQAFPVPNGGQFRTACEFSHFSYDDPLVYPGKPGAAHLHMNFGNTDVNAYSTADSLLNSGSSTCNGQELNRTGYWVPAMFDGKGNVRIPERIVVYYKGEGLARGKAEVYPAGAAMVMNENLNAVGNGTGGAAGKFSFVCANNYSANGGKQSNVIPDCDGSKFKKLYGADDPRMVLEMNVKFPQCWNGKDPSNPANFRHPRNGSWYYSLCENDFNHTLPNLEYFVNYVVDQGENTSDWYLASDVQPTQFGTSKADGGSTVHGDWWGAWHRQTNEMWINNCVNYKTGAASGCGMGYLTDGGPNGSAPYDGPALKYRPQYTGPNKVSAQTLFNELCPNPDRGYSQPEDAAFCRPSSR